MSEKNITNYDLVVIGGGIGGAASALRAAQYQIKTLWIQGDRQSAKKSRGKWVRNVDNMMGAHPGIVLNKLKNKWKDRPDLLAALDEVGEITIGTQDMIDNVEERLASYSDWVSLLKAQALEIQRDAEGCFIIKTADQTQSECRAKYVVLSTGVMDRQPYIAKQKKDKVLDSPAWIYPFANNESILYCIRCEGHLTRGHRVAVIGSSESTAQVALMLAERYGSVCCLLTNGEEFSAETETRRVLDLYGIEIYNKRIVDIVDQPGKRGSLRALILEDGKEIQVDFAVASLGLYEVYNKLARDLGAELLETHKPEDQRRVRIDKHAETTIKNFFVVGDMALRPDEAVMMQIYTAQEYAVRAVDTVDSRRRQEKRQGVLGR